MMRKMTVADVDAVYVLGCERYDLSDPAFQDWSKDMVRAYLCKPGSECWLVMRDGRLTGMTLSSLLPNGTGYVEWTAAEGSGVSLFRAVCLALERRGAKRVVTDMAGPTDQKRRVLTRLGFAKESTVEYWGRVGTSGEAIPNPSNISSAFGE